MTPVYPKLDDPTYKEFQASSPDEVALVKFADSLNMRLKDRDQQNSMTILNANDFEEIYEIKAIFPFSSETKRMGIIVKNVQSGKIIFYLKGAETVMKNKVKPS